MKTPPRSRTLNLVLVSSLIVAFAVFTHGGGGKSTNQIKRLVKYGLHLNGKGDKEKAYYILTNAKVFGKYLDRINPTLNSLPEPSNKMSANINDDAGMAALEKQIARLAQGVGQIDIDLNTIKEKVKTSAKSDQTEAAMLLDKKMVGSCACQGMSGEGMQFLWFMDSPSASLDKIQGKYGAPTATAKGKKNRYAFYGRIFLMEKPGGEVTMFRVLSQ